MCRHIYDWNIVNCDVKQPIQLNSTHIVQFISSINGKKFGIFVNDAEHVSVLEIYSFDDFRVFIFYHLDGCSYEIRKGISHIYLSLCNRMILLRLCVTLTWHCLSFLGACHTTVSYIFPVYIWYTYWFYQVVGQTIKQDGYDECLYLIENIKMYLWNTDDQLTAKPIASYKTIYLRTANGA